MDPIGTEIDTESGAALWADYVAANRRHAGPLPVTERFGDSAAMADELLALVLGGPKRATAGAVVDYVAADESLPRIGGHWIVADGDGTARAILRIIELRIGALGSVDDAFAWDEGEGDRSRRYWLEAHRAFFRRRCAQLGVPFGDDLEVVFERFALVWPPQRDADA